MSFAAVFFLAGCNGRIPLSSLLVQNTMSALLASDRLSALQGDLAVAVTAKVVDSWSIGSGVVAGVVRLDGGGAAGWDLVCFAVGGHACAFEVYVDEVVWFR